MRSGDGWVVRVRPAQGRLSARQAAGLCNAARSHGAGVLDLTNRANLQIRGVPDTALAPLQTTLAQLDLLDSDPEREARRNILIAPDWQQGDDSQRLWDALAARLMELPALPPKMGFAMDAGSAPILSDAPADFRIERSADGRLILRAEGRAYGMALEYGAEIATLLRLAQWFVDSGGHEAGRMARHEAPLPDWGAWTLPPARARGPLSAGPPPPGGMALGAAFGQVDAADLEKVLEATGARAIRLTPWRLLVLEEVDALPVLPDSLIATPDHPALRVDACAGAPFCPQASVETRALARALGPHVAGSLHVSGCAKGCARARAADMTLVGRAGAFDLVPGGRAGDVPLETGLTPTQILTRFGA
ncbi:MAG: cobalamin biosynthesis protein CobG [Rhodobacteraceae bacterium]|nr:cobalamin biosynthesis protein CobG [Paracoccaceae bacterium]